MTKKQNITYKQVVALCDAIRSSFMEASIVYTYGGCYDFYKILKSAFPTAQPYFMNKHRGHILAKIENKFYDIDGLMIDHEKEDNEFAPIRLTSDDVIVWEQNMNTTTIERIMMKYKSRTRELYN